MTLDDAIASLRAYADEGRPTGGFLEAVLSNELMEALQRADESSLANLPAICRYVYHDLPMHCWGSPDVVGAWMTRHAERRRAGEVERPMPSPDRIAEILRPSQPIATRRTQSDDPAGLSERTWDQR